uniref:SEA domain-containing protein n=1 Tax=Trichuris muris TaxID=70415 RepID=A0A5S6QVL0_TRIMR
MSGLPMANESFGRRASYTPSDKASSNELGMSAKKVTPIGLSKVGPARTTSYDQNSNLPSNSFQMSGATSNESPRKKRSLVTLCLILGIILLLLAIVLPIVLLGHEYKTEYSNETIPLKGSLLSQLRHLDDRSTLHPSFFHFLKDRCDFVHGNSQNQTSNADHSAVDSLILGFDCNSETLYKDYMTLKMAHLMKNATGSTGLCAAMKCDSVKVENLQLDDEFINFDFQIELWPNEMGAIELDDVSLSELILTTRRKLKQAFKETFDPFTIDKVIVEFELKDLCGRHNVHCSDAIKSTWILDREGKLCETKEKTTNKASETPSEVVLSVESLRGNLPPMVNCTEHGFSCLDKKKTISSAQICDGQPQCDDGSDEANCTACQTSFSCNKSDGTLMCLRGVDICNGKNDCEDKSDESPTLYCRANCTDDEYKCQGANVCIPKSWICDGDNHCPNGDDESECRTADSCKNNARWCSTNGNCTAQWYICDGITHCPNASEETNCTCEKCSASHLALCRQPGKCIVRHRVCDGIIDCPDEEDELNCPGWCQMETKPERIKCHGGVMYPKDAVCTGKVHSCRESCPGCDPDEAFRCNKTGSCIERNKICDAHDDCLDGSDESPELCSCNETTAFACNVTAGQTRCIPKKYRCDGYHDCLGSMDEKDCDSCFNNPRAFYCNATRTCFPRTARCNGEVDCPDYSDEDNCTCTECKNQLEPTFMCREQKRCLLRRHTCNQKSPFHCPGAAPEDEMFCPPLWDPFRGLNEA